MKLIRVIKLARVKYGDLDEGDEFFYRMCDTETWLSGTDGAYWPTQKALRKVHRNDSEMETFPVDTDKYPPEEVTYTIEGISADDIQAICERGAMYFPDNFFDESEIETRYV